MRRSMQRKQTDLFSVPSILPSSLPAPMRADLVRFLSALLLEVIAYQQHSNTAQQETDHEQQHHA